MEKHLARQKLKLSHRPYLEPLSGGLRRAATTKGRFIFLAGFAAGNCRVANGRSALQGLAVLSRFFRMAALAAALPVLAQDYEIRLHRPDRVGDKTKFSGVCKNRQEMTAWADGKKILEENKDLAVNFEGIGTVLEVSPKGKAKRLSLQVDKLSAMEGKIQKELLPRGTVVVAANVAKKKGV